MQDQGNGQHTLVLFDVTPEKGSSIGAEEYDRRHRNYQRVYVRFPLKHALYFVILGFGVKLSIAYLPAAIGESGLDIYKFGPTATIPRISERYKPIM